MHENEEATHAAFNAAMSSFIVPALQRHQGRIVKSTGDGFLAEFSSAVEAVRSALEFQEALLQEAILRPPKQRLQFRVGIDVGDVIIEEHDIFGDHVNIAARLEQLCQPGGVLISDNARHYVQGRVEAQFHDLGERQVKNIASPIRMFQILVAGNEEPFVPPAGPPAASPDSIPKLHLLGPVSLQAGKQDIPLRSLKARAALAYVALGESRLETRERLVGLLWSGSSEARARGLLTPLLRDLRASLEAARCAGIRFGTHEIGLDPDAIQVDMFEVLKAAEAGEAHPLLLERRNLLDELLVGLEGVDPAFRVWLIAKRNSLRDRLLFALENAMAAKQAGSPAESRLATALINLDPTHEDACRRLMQARVTAGDAAGALRIYKTLSDLLAQNYEMEPSAATKALAAEIRSGNAPRSPARSDAPSTPRFKGASRLAISLPPVTAHEVSPEKIHLVTGFRQHLIASLIRFREWHVTDTPAGDLSMDEAHRVTNRYELQMNVHQDGSALHVLLMLKEAGNSLYVWSDGFELKLESWFEAQRQVVQKIALALNVNLSAERLRRLSEDPGISLGIYDRWLRSQTLIRTFSLEHWKRASSEFLGILEDAPTFVPAYCGLADMHNTEHIVYPGRLRTRERERQAIQFARKAVELDPVNMHAHRSLAWANVMAHQHTPAAMSIQTAFELNPNDPWTHFSAALLYAFCGRSDRSAELVQFARDMALVPSKMHWAYLVDVHFLSGDYAAAVEASDNALDYHRTVRAWRAAALAQLGDTKAAAQEARTFLQQVRQHWFGADPPTDDAILRWMLHLYPIARREDWERLRDGLGLAGMPVDGIDYRSWEQAPI
jgi:DNA-binding SARP family transcriptional activator/TolB-like protein